MHISVLYYELIDNLNVSDDGIYVDCTGGGGGHASLLLERLGENGRLIVLDRDIEGVGRVKEKVVEEKRIGVMHSNFAEFVNALLRRNIEKLNGIITIDSKINEGSTFYLKLPLTLAIIQALLVEVAGETFAIPLASVVETVRITNEEIHSFEGREVLKLRDRVLSLIRLDEAFALDELEQDEIYVVVVALAEKQLGFIVDKLIGQEEIVIKSLGRCN